MNKDKTSRGNSKSKGAITGATLTQVKNALHIHASLNKRPEYAPYVAKAVHSAILSGSDHPLKDLVIRWVESFAAVEAKKNIPKDGEQLRRYKNRIAAEETLALNENTFVGECSKHGYAKFYVYKNSGYACTECRKESRITS